MAYGSLKANTIIFNSGGTDYTLDVTTLVSNGSNFSGGVIQANSITGLTGVFTTLLSGALITGTTSNITTFSGATGIFTSLLSGASITGTSVNATSITGQTVSGVTVLAETGTIGNLTSTGSISGGTLSGTTATFTSVTGVSGIYTTEVSGAAITGTSVNATNITGSTVTATTLTATTGDVGDLTASTSVSGGTLSGTTATFTSVTGASGNFTSVISGTLYKCSGNVTIISGAGDIRPYGLYSFPQSAGTNNYVLSTNGDGTTAWVEATGGGGGGSSYTVSGLTTNETGVAGTYYVLLSGLTLTLPTTPSQGDYVGIINRSNTTTGTVARNGSNIMGLAEDMTLNDLNARFRLIYVNASEGWVTL